MHDIDGSLVPQVYFDYVRGLRRERIIPVFDHNAQDIISLAALLARFAHYYCKPDSQELNHAFDLIGLSHLFERNGQVSQAVECMERALLFARDEHLSHLISAHIAKIYKRQSRWDDAVQLWHAQIAGSHIYNLNAFVELAKYYEHRAKNHARAQEIVVQALKYLEIQRDLDDILDRESRIGNFNAILNDLEYRLNRLKRRLVKSPSTRRQAPNGDG
jgi:tetratricopeptide (TPR) repeat protein